MKKTTLTAVLAATAFSLATHSVPATAQGIDAESAAAGATVGATTIAPLITRIKARAIARRTMRSLGYTRNRRSSTTAVISHPQLDGDHWRVPVKFGGRLPKNYGVVLIDADSGDILGH